jgi:hypothetical protein
MGIIRLKFSTLRQSRWYEHLVRLVLGGLATVFAGAVAKWAGPSWGGLFLAFPAVFCASSTLIEKHERERKEAKHLKGDRRGQAAAGLDAFGTALGAMGMIAFALTVWFGSDMYPPIALGLAMAAWVAVAGLAWYLCKSFRNLRT